MTIECLDDIKEHAKQNISEVINSIDIDTSSDLEDIKQEIEQALESNGFYAPEVIYYHEAWSIVARSSFNDFDPKPDFSSCSSALDCVMLEANEIVNDAYYSVLYEAIEETAEQLIEIIELANDLECDYGQKVTISSACLFGWAVHNRETETGICIYDDKPGFYNPELIEGELIAIEAGFNGLYASVCWTPERN